MCSDRYYSNLFNDNWDWRGLVMAVLALMFATAMVMTIQKFAIRYFF